jgi:DNA-binding MarR family transcriptional regulator
LTPRESEVALLVERNLSNDEIARELGIKRSTVKIHVHKILKKGGLSRRLQRPSKGTKFPRRMSGAGRERIREAQRRRWQRWRAARSDDNT